LTVAVFVEESLFHSLQQSELKALAEAFKAYKENTSYSVLGIQLGHAYFGKDEALTQPSEVRGILYKVHFRPDTPKKAVKSWLNAINQGKVPTSDHILVYCRGKKNHNSYLLIDLLKPDGHKKIKDYERLLKLKNNFADPFRAEY
jgi:hypothetical protein